MMIIDVMGMANPTPMFMMFIDVIGMANPTPMIMMIIDLMGMAIQLPIIIYELVIAQYCSAVHYAMPIY